MSTIVIVFIVVVLALVLADNITQMIPPVALK